MSSETRMSRNCADEISSSGIDAVTVPFNNTGAVDVAKQLRQKVGVNGEEPGEIENGKVRLYVIGQGALGSVTSSSPHRSGISSMTLSPRLLAHRHRYG